MVNSRDDFTNDHLHGTILTQQKRRDIAVPMMVASFVLVTASLISYLLKRKSLKVGPQIIAMILGIIIVLTVNWINHPALAPFSNMFVNPYKVLAFYYPLITLKFIYALDTCLFTKYLSRIIIISSLSWCTFVVCFGFLLITFAGEVSGLSLTQLLFVGIIFAPIEIPNVILNIDHFKLAEVVLISESMISSIMSSMSIAVLFGAMDVIFDRWYQPILVILTNFIVGLSVGVIFGLIAGLIFSKTCTNSTNATLSLATSVYLMFHFCQYVLHCDPGLGCSLFVFFISRKRIDIPKEIDKEIIILIEIIYTCMSIIINFIAVVLTFPHFVMWFDAMGAAVAAALYICANVLRFVFYLMMSPLISRMRYGHNFKTLVCMVWCVRKGPLTFIMLSMTVVEGYDAIVARRLLHFGLIYLLLMNALNDVSAWTMLEKMSFTRGDLFLKRENFKNALNYIIEKRNNLLAVVRMSRFYSDANWKLIRQATAICQSLKAEDNLGSDDTEKVFRRNEPYCSSCKMQVLYEPSQKEYDQTLSEIKIRLLHATKVSFVRQYEKGLIEDRTLQVLYHLYETAVQSKNLTLIIDDILKELRMKHRNKFGKSRTYVYSHSRKEIMARYVPRFRKNYIIKEHWAFARLFDLMTLMHFIVAFIIILNYSTVAEILNISVTSLFIVEFFIKWYGSIQFTYKDGFKRYIRTFWNKLEFCVLILGVIDIPFTLTNLYFQIAFVEGNKRVLKYIVTGLRMLRFFRLARIILLYRIISKLHVATIDAYDKKIDSRISQIYAIGKALVICYEEVDDILENVTKDSSLVDLLRAQNEEDKNKIARELGMIEHQRPWVTTRVKTRQAMISTMKTMSCAVDQLQSAGMIDEHELTNIRRVLTERWKAILPIKLTPMTTPKSLFYEIPWIARDDAVFEYLYENLSLKVWDSGDVIISEGDIDKGILIIISGMIKMTYTPNKETMNLLQHHGLLPIRDLIQHTRFKAPLVEYIFTGNSIGELSAMTGRPYCCEIVAETPSQAFIISPKVIDEALKLSSDPITGLYSRIWLHISNAFVRRVLLMTPLFSKMQSDQLDSIIVRSFVPRMEMFIVFYLNPLIEDVVIIEGSIVDYQTREIYVGPSYIPRGISKLMVPEIEENKESEYVIPKILVIPMIDVDPYEVMMLCELTSELNPKAPSSYFLRTNFYRKWQKHGKNRLFSRSSSRALNSSTGGFSIHKMLFQGIDKSKGNLNSSLSMQEILEMLHSGGASMRSVSSKDNNSNSVAKFWNPSKPKEEGVTNSKDTLSENRRKRKRLSLADEEGI